MESFDISRVTIMVLIAIIVIILFTRMSSSYTAGTPANDASLYVQPQQNADGSYKDISTSDPVYANMQLETTAGVSVADANKNCWAKTNCWGIRHTFDPDNAQKTYYVIGTPTQFVTAPLSAITPRSWLGINYAFPAVYIAAKSSQDPEAPVNCTWSPATGSCSTTTCNNPGTQTITWTASPAAHGGTCSPAPPSTPVACNTNNPCPKQTYTRTFTTVGTTSWTVPAGVTSVWVLVVGGGGAGGQAIGTLTQWNMWGVGGGGGGGGVVENTSYSVTPGNSVTVTVGGGGVSQVSTATGGNGGPSVFGTLTAYGGGQGGGILYTTGAASSPDQPGQSGGCGGGGMASWDPTTTTSAGSGTSGQGYGGGGANRIDAYGVTWVTGGGGGGAGGAGRGTYRDGNDKYPGGPGGPGYSSSITGTSTYYSGGGGGGGGSVSDKNGYTYGGTGGTGGGGTGGGPGQGVGGSATYYGGGGGGSSLFRGGSGYQGIVIVSYTV